MIPLILSAYCYTALNIHPLITLSVWYVVPLITEVMIFDTWRRQK